MEKILGTANYIIFVVYSIFSLILLPLLFRILVNERTLSRLIYSLIVSTLLLGVIILNFHYGKDMFKDDPKDVKKNILLVLVTGAPVFYFIYDIIVIFV